MIATLFLLLLLGLLFPKPVGQLFNGAVSILGKILYPCTIGLINVIGMLLKGIFQAFWYVLQWLFGVFARLFQAFRL